MIWSYIAAILGMLGGLFLLASFVSFVLFGDFAIWTTAP